MAFIVNEVFIAVPLQLLRGEEGLMKDGRRMGRQR